MRTETITPLNLKERVARTLPPKLRGRWGWVIVAVLLLVGVRVALPSVVKSYVNKTLNELSGYRGHVEDIDINLWRGAYEIEGLALEKVTGTIPVPFISADRLDLSIEWSALFHGSLVGEVEFQNLKVNFVQGPTDKESQSGGGNDFAETVKKLFPLKINRFDIQNGEVHFRNFHTDPRVDIYLDSLFVHATNLTNSKGLSQTLVASVEATGKAMEMGRLGGKLQIDPFTPLPTFSLDLRVENVELTRMNDFFGAYANIDVESGTFKVYSEIASRNGEFTGYVKPFFENMNIIDLEEDTKQPLKFLWELIVEGAAQLFTNPSNDQVSTKIQLSGTLNDPDADILSAIGGLLKNAFIKALQPGIEGTVALRSVPPE